MVAEPKRQWRFKTGITSEVWIRCSRAPLSHWQPSPISCSVCLERLMSLVMRATPVPLMQRLPGRPVPPAAEMQCAGRSVWLSPHALLGWQQDFLFNVYLH